MTRTRPAPILRARSARAALPAEGGPAVFVMTQAARAALCGRFGLESDGGLERALGRLGAARVEGPDAPGGPIDTEAAELVRRVREGRLPWFIHACPCWRRDMLRRTPWLAAHFSRPACAPDAPRVAVVDCEARRSALAREGWTHVLTVREAALWLMRSGVSPVRGQPRPSEGPGWLERVAARAQQMAGGQDDAPLILCQGPAGVETGRFALLDREVRAARVRGAARMERMLEAAGPEGLPWDLIEVLACAGGCERG